MNTTADATNKLAVRSNNVLLNALEAAGGGSGDIRVAINKEGVSDTASLVLQTGFSGRAEIGLTGSDDFEFRTSADGSSYSTAMTIAASGGFVLFNQMFGAETSFPTVASGVLDAATSSIVPAPETGISDAIDTISGGFDGALLIICGSAGVTLTFNDGTGNLKLGANRVLDNFEDCLTLVRRGSDWLEIAYANNG